MARVRHAIAAENFERFVGTASKDPTHVFPTFAHLLAAAAALGARPDVEEELVPEFNKDKDPVNWEIFERQGLADLMRLIAIEVSGEPGLVDDDDRVCEIVETASASGFNEMLQILEGAADPDLWPQYWRDYVIQKAEDDENVRASSEIEGEQGS